MKSRSDESTVEAVKDIYGYLKMKNLQSKLCVLGNKCSKAVKIYIRSNGTNIQIVEPHNHSVNAAEPTVKAIKYHVIAGLAIVDINCPLQLWDLFLPQIQDTLNLLRTSRLNPAKSAYEEMEVKFDLNRTPISILGTKALAFVDPDERISWEAHEVDCYVTGLCPDHYCLLHFFCDPHQKHVQNRCLIPLSNKLQDSHHLQNRPLPPGSTKVFAFN